MDEGDCRDATAGEDAGCVAAIEFKSCEKREAGRNRSVGCNKVRGWSIPTVLSSMPIAARLARFVIQRRELVHRGVHRYL